MTSECEYNHSNDELLTEEREEETEERGNCSINEQAIIRESIAALANVEQRDAALCRLRAIWDAYLECPTRLDACFEEWVAQLTTNAMDCSKNAASSALEYRLSALYALAKVRGRKRLQRFLPHSANIVHPVWMALQRSAAQYSSDEKTRVSPPPIWESTYVLWIWMTACSYVPLDAHLLVVQHNFLSALLDTAAAAPAGPLQTVASACAAAWLARPDADESFWRHAQSAEMNYGRLQTLVALLKVSSAPRERLRQRIQPLEETIRRWSGDNRESDWLVQKLLVKWWTRSAVTFLPPVVHRRFRRRNESAAAPKEEASTTVMSADSNDTAHWIDRVEFAMDRILEALTHTSTLVRVAAAKGVGRITERLPELAVEDVLDALLHRWDGTDDADRDRSWHGVCLALAELARRGLLQRLDAVLPRLVTAIQYDPHRAARGAAVRDAACYTYWALARAYPPEILLKAPHIMELRDAVLWMSLFDREVNGRRSASAAFQEAVGRQGATHVPHGLDIMTVANYYSLGNRSQAYLTMAVELAQYDALRRPMICHLYTTQLLHWDIAIRTLSSQTLHRLTPLDPTFMAQVVIPKLLDQCLDEHHLSTRHGAVLGVAEIIQALEHQMLSPPTLQKLVDLVPAMEQKRLYRGRGGEWMRLAVCRLMECICIAKIPLKVPEQVRLLDSIDANLPHPTESIQLQACQSLQALLTFYFPVGVMGPSERLQQRVIHKFLERLTNENPAVARGYALALGYLPDKLVGCNEKILQSILDALIRTAHHASFVGQTERDAATRKNALLSLLRISRTVGWSVQAPMSSNAVYRVVSCHEGMFVQLWNAFLVAMEDYNTDRRGDVGSWCRLVGIESITELILALSQCDATRVWISDLQWITTVSALLKQCAEKLDTVRICAGAALEQLLHDPYLSDLPHSTSLIRTLQLPLRDSISATPLSSRRWYHDLTQTFTMVMVVASFSDAFLESIVLGIVSSVGGLSEDVRQSSSSALIFWTKGSSPVDREKLSVLLLRLLEENERNVRLVQPILKTMDLLITHGCFDIIIQSSSTTLNWTSQCIVLLERIAMYNSNVSCLGTVVDVTVSLLAARPAPLAPVTAAQALLCRQLAHPFPRVRSYTAQQFFVYLSIDDDEEKENRLAVQELMSTTPWTKELPKHELHRVPTTIAEQLGILEEFQQPSLQI